jgi:hypothetical protein
MIRILYMLHYYISACNIAGAALPAAAAARPGPPDLPGRHRPLHSPGCQRHHLPREGAGAPGRPAGREDRRHFRLELPVLTPAAGVACATQQVQYSSVQYILVQYSSVFGASTRCTALQRRRSAVQCSSMRTAHCAACTVSTACIVHNLYILQPLELCTFHFVRTQHITKHSATVAL